MPAVYPTRVIEIYPRDLLLFVAHVHWIFTWPAHWIFSAGNRFRVRCNTSRPDATSCVAHRVFHKSSYSLVKFYPNTMLDYAYWTLKYSQTLLSRSNYGAHISPQNRENIFELLAKCYGVSSHCYLVCLSPSLFNLLSFFCHKLKFNLKSNLILRSI